MVPVQKLVWSPALVPRLLFLIQRMVLLRLLFLISGWCSSGSCS